MALKDQQESKLHYKMYKKGRLWVFMGIALVGGITFGEVSQPKIAYAASEENVASTVSNSNSVSNDADVSADVTNENEKTSDSLKSNTGSKVSESASKPNVQNEEQSNDTQSLDNQTENKSKGVQSPKLTNEQVVSDNSVDVESEKQNVNKPDNQEKVTTHVARPTAVAKSASDITVDTTTGTGSGDYDAAKPITDNTKAVVPAITDKLDSKYAFIPKFNGSGNTKTSVIGQSMSTTKPDTIAADLVTAQKGDIGFKYTNVGYNAEGQSMDMNIIFTDWGRLSDISDAYVETYTNMIYTNFPGAGWVDVKYQFVRSDTGEEELVSGVMTLTDIDSAQTVAISDDQWNKIDKVYVPTSVDPTTGENGNWLHYSNEADYTVISSPKINSDATDEYAMLTFAYSKQSSLTFRYSNGKDTPTKMTVWGVNYVAQKPLATATIAPTATVSDSDQKNVKNNTLRDGESTYNYSFNQVIPDEWAQFYYHDVSFTGEVPTGVAVKSYRVTTETGQNVTQYFSNQSTGQTFKLVVSSDYLNDAEFYGHYYTITTSVNANQTDVLQHVTMKIATNINDETRSSNIVITAIDKKHYLLTHYYIQNTGTRLANDDKVRIVYGTNYEASQKSINGYQLINQVATKGTFNDESVEAIYEYAPIIIEIPVTYVDQNGKSIAESTILTGKYDSNFDAQSVSKKIMGYTLNNIENQKGTYLLDNKSVILHYQADPAIAKISYRDAHTGKSLTDDKTIKGLYNDNYDLNNAKKFFNGYYLTQQPENIAGKYSLNPVTIEFVYMPVTISIRVLDITDLNETLSDRMISGYYNDPYEVKTLENIPITLSYADSNSPLSGKFIDNGMIIINQYRYVYGNTTVNGNGSLTTIIRDGNDKVVGIQQLHDDGTQTNVSIDNKNNQLNAGMYDIGKDRFISFSKPIMRGESLALTGLNGTHITVKYLINGGIEIEQSTNSLNSKGDKVVVSKNGKMTFSTMKFTTAVKGLSNTKSLAMVKQSWASGNTLTVVEGKKPQFSIANLQNELQATFGGKNFKKRQIFKIDGYNYQLSVTRNGLFKIQEFKDNKQTTSALFNSNGLLLKSPANVAIGRKISSRSAFVSEIEMIDKNYSILRFSLNKYKVKITNAFGQGHLEVRNTSGKLIQDELFSNNVDFKVGQTALSLEIKANGKFSLSTGNENQSQVAKKEKQKNTVLFFNHKSTIENTEGKKYVISESEFYRKSLRKEKAGNTGALMANNTSATKANLESKHKNKQKLYNADELPQTNEKSNDLIKVLGSVFLSVLFLLGISTIKKRKFNSEN